MIDNLVSKNKISNINSDNNKQTNDKIKNNDNYENKKKKIKHKKNNNFMCCICKESKETSDDLAEHVVKEHETPVKCAYWSEEMEIVLDIVQHKCDSMVIINDKLTLYDNNSLELEEN
jgi:hypothetical protein